MYLDYEKFKEYGGNLSNTDFDRFLFRAEQEIDLATQNRCAKLAEYPEALKRCVFELVIYLSNNAKNGSVSAVTSFGNDGYSVSYAENKTASEQIYDIIYTYLANTGLMYCGVN